MLQIQQNFQGQWLEIENFRHVDHFRDITTLLPHIVKNAKSISANKKYESYFKKFKQQLIHSILKTGYNSSFCQ